MNSSLDPVLTREGWDLLTRLQALPHTTEADQAHLNALLRKEGIEPALVSALLTQLDLRVHAHTKFGEFANHMIFTRDGLEQATRLNVAAHHAGRFRDGGATYVADLGCGIGSDSLAIASLGLKTLSVDLNPDAVACAATNLRDFPDSDVLLGNVLDLDIHELADRGVDAIFADPARRTGAKRGSTRLMDPESWSPSLSTVLGWREAIPRVGIKVAPGITYSALPEDASMAPWSRRQFGLARSPTMVRVGLRASSADRGRSPCAQFTRPQQTLHLSRPPSESWRITWLNPTMQ